MSQEVFSHPMKDEEAVGGEMKAQLDTGKTEISDPDPQVIGSFDVESEEYKRMSKRLYDIWVMPMCTLIYIFSALDKGNLGNAKVLGLVTDFGGDATGKRYALLNATYFIGYVAFLVPGSLLGKRTKPNIVMAVAAICWGACATLTAATNSWAQASGTRFLVGVFESGFGPVIPFYITRWYTRSELGLRMAVWQGSAQISGVINGLIAYGLARRQTQIESWKLLYLIEGSATVVFAVIALLILPGHPRTTKIFTEQERTFAIARKAGETGQDSATIHLRHVLESFYDLRLILPSITYGIAILTGAVISAFLPTLIKELGYSGADAQLMTLPCYLSTMVMIWITSRASDYWHNRAWPIALGFGFQVLGFAMLLGGKPSQHGLRYAALVFATIGVGVPIPLHLTWVAENAGNETKKAVQIALMVAVAQALAIASGYEFPADQAPRYIKGTSICLALAIMTLIILAIHSYLLRRENARRDAAEGDLTGVIMQTGDLADKAVGWRFQP